MANKHTRYVSLMKSFGKAVRFHRTRLGLSQEALADRAQLDRSYMSQIERGIKNATLNSIWRIAQSLEVHPSELLKMTEELGMGTLVDGDAALPAPDPNIKNATVLVVDDDEDICQAIEGMLKFAGFKARQANSGLDAMRIMASEKVHVVVSDIRMANGNGFELLESLRKHYSSVPVFFITGFPDVSLEDALNRGAKGLFNKPLDQSDFVQSLRLSLAAASSE